MLEKDKAGQSKYYLSYPKPPVLNMARENRDTNVAEWANIPTFPPLLNGDQEMELRLMECLTPSVSFDLFMDNYFTSFRLLIILGVNNIRATSLLNKYRSCKCTIIGDKQLQKKGTWPL